MTFSPGFKKYFANTSWLMSQRILSSVVSLFVGVYVARYLGPSKLGLLSYSKSFVGLFIVIALLGLDQIVIRELVKKPDQINSLMGTAFWIKIGGVLLMWITIYVTTHFINNTRETNLLIALISFAYFFQAFNVIDFNFQAKVQSKYVVYVQIAQLTISSAIKISLVMFSAPLSWFAWAFLVDSSILAVGLIITYQKKIGRILEWHWSFQTAVTMLKASWPLIIAGLSVSVYMKVDQVMIKEMLGAEEVGLYAVAVSLSEAWYFIPVTIAASLFPAIIHSKNESEITYNQRLQKFYNLMVYLAIAIALPTTLLSSWVVNLLFGEAYLRTAAVLSIYIWAGIFVFLGVANGQWLIVENLQKILMFNTAVGAIMNIILNIILIKIYRINGAAIATIISYAYSGYLGLSVFKASRPSFIRLTKALFFYDIFKN